MMTKKIKYYYNPTKDEFYEDEIDWFPRLKRTSIEYKGAQKEAGVSIDLTGLDYNKIPPNFILLKFVDGELIKRTDGDYCPNIWDFGGIVKETTNNIPPQHREPNTRYFNVIVFID